MATILVIDDDPELVQWLDQVLSTVDHRVESSATLQDATNRLNDAAFDIVLLDVELPDGLGTEFLPRLKDRWPDAITLMMTANATTEHAVAAMRAGAVDFILKPLNAEELLRRLERIGRERKILAELGRYRRTAEVLATNVLIGDSPATLTIKHMIERVSRTRTTVLITGETGVGKEVVANAIHQSSEERSGPFISLNCGALPENLIESELFGHVKGAFTGADRDHIGLLEAADGGTLFLDEVGELTLATQVKLLRVLEERAVRRLGDTRSRPFKIRLVSATNRDLAEQVAVGAFRQDLAYRLRVLEIHVPPLRERSEDIPAIADHFVAQLSHEMHVARLGISPEAQKALSSYSWPGNVRELRNVIERALLFENTDQIQVSSIHGVVDTPMLAAMNTTKGPTTSLEDATNGFQRKFIDSVLQLCEGNRSKAARELGVDRSTLYRKMAELGLE